MRRIALAEDVGEEFLFQCFQRDLRLAVLHLDGDDLAGLGHRDLLRVISKVKAVADLLGDELFGLFVVVGVDGVGAVLVIIALQVDRVTGRGVIIEAEIGEVARREPLDDRVIERIGVEVDGRGAGGDGDGACLFIDLDDGVDAVCLDIACGLVDEGTDVLGVEVQAGFQIDVIFVMLRAVVGDERGDGAAAAAILHGLVDGLVGVQRDLADLRRERQRTIREHNSQRVGRGVLVDSLLHGVDGGVTLQPADVDARNIDIRVDGVLPFQDHAVGTDAEHGHQDDAAENDADFFAAAGLFRGGRAAGMLLRGGRLAGRLLRLKFSSFQMRSLLFGTRQNCREVVIMDYPHYSGAGLDLQWQFNQESVSEF